MLLQPVLRPFALTDAADVQRFAGARSRRHHCQHSEWRAQQEPNA